MNFIVTASFDNDSNPNGDLYEPTRIYYFGGCKSKKQFAKEVLSEIFKEKVSLYEFENLDSSVIEKLVEKAMSSRRVYNEDYYVDNEDKYKWSYHQCKNGRVQLKNGDSFKNFCKQIIEILVLGPSEGYVVGKEFDECPYKRVYKYIINDEHDEHEDPILCSECGAGLEDDIKCNTFTGVHMYTCGENHIGPEKRQCVFLPARGDP